MRFIIKKCRPTNPSNVFITIILKLENAMKPSGVPDHLFLNKRVFRINITFQVTLRTFFTNLKKKKYSKKKKKKKKPKKSEKYWNLAFLTFKSLRKQLENYSFLGWFIDFLKLRNGTRSIYS